MSQFEEVPAPRTISGKWVVLALFAFGLLAVGVIWTYAVVELGPFEPLARALQAEFPGSRPHVKGGTPRNKPPLLRIILEVDFTPTADDPRIITMTERVMALAKQHIQLSEYEDFELHFVRYVPESGVQRVTIEKKVKELFN